MKTLMFIVLSFVLVACGSSGGGGGGGEQTSPLTGNFSIVCAGVYNTGGEHCTPVSPGAQIWLGSANGISRNQVIFLVFRLRNTTPGTVQVAFEINTTLGRDGCAGTQFLSLGSIARDVTAVESGQFTQIMAAIYCPGAELNRQQQFQPAITVNGERVFIDGVFNVTG